MTVTEPRNEQSTQSTQGTIGKQAAPMTRRLRPSVLYLQGRPAQSWVDALSRGTIIHAK